MMWQAGIMSEMVEDAIDTLDDDEEEIEEEAEQEVENVLFDITDGKLGQMGSVGGKLPVQLLFCLSPPPFLGVCW